MNQHHVLSLPRPPRCPRSQSRVSLSVGKTFVQKRRSILDLDIRAVSTLLPTRSTSACCMTPAGIVRHQTLTLQSINSLNGPKPIAVARAIRSQKVKYLNEIRLYQPVAAVGDGRLQERVKDCSGCTGWRCVVCVGGMSWEGGCSGCLLVWGSVHWGFGKGVVGRLAFGNSDCVWCDVWLFLVRDG